MKQSARAALGAWGRRELMLWEYQTFMILETILKNNNIRYLMLILFYESHDLRACIGLSCRIYTNRSKYITIPSRFNQSNIIYSSRTIIIIHVQLISV